MVLGTAPQLSTCASMSRTPDSEAPSSSLTTAPLEFDAPAADLCAAAAARGPAEPADKSAAAAKRASGKGRAPG